MSANGTGQTNEEVSILLVRGENPAAPPCQRDQQDREMEARDISTYNSVGKHLHLACAKECSVRILAPEHIIVPHRGR
jgi:hypothetical protein